MDLTPGDTKVAQKVLRRLERRAREWKWTRWIGLCAAGVMLGLAAWTFWRARPACPVPAGLSENRLNGGAISALELKLYAYTTAMLWSMAVSLVTLGIMMGSFGSVYLVLLLANWNRHVCDALLAGLLRAELERMSSQDRSDSP